MRDKSIRTLAVLVALVLILAALPQVGAAAGKDDSPAKKSGEGSSKEIDRLPNFYGQVVNPEQRIEIYTIQDDYRDRIAALRAQLEATIAERDEKIEAVLTPAQRKQVREAEAESKAKAQERRSDADEADATSSSGKSAAKESEKSAAEKTATGKTAPEKATPAKAPTAKSATGKATTGKAATSKSSGK